MQPDRFATRTPYSGQNVEEPEPPRSRPTAAKPPAKPEGIGISRGAIFSGTEPGRHGFWTPNAEIPQTTDFHPAKGRLLRFAGADGATGETCRSRETPGERSFPGG